MQRRALVSGILVAGGVAAGHLLKARFYNDASPTRNPGELAAAMAGARLQHAPNELLLKFYLRTVNDQNRQKVVREVMDHTSNIRIARSSLFPRCGSRTSTVTAVATNLMLAKKLNPESGEPLIKQAG